MNIMQQKKRFISPGAWFAMDYPSEWSEFEDEAGTFLFYNPNIWTGNFRISAYRDEQKGADGKSTYASDAVAAALKENRDARRVQLGAMTFAYGRESFEENEQSYTDHYWVGGDGDTMFECSFTVAEGESAAEAEQVIASLEIRHEGVKYPAEIIQARIPEIYLIDQSYEWVVGEVKERLKADFQGTEEDLPKIQSIIDGGTIGRKKRDEWVALGIAVCIILANEVEGLEWRTLIDGNREAPVMVYTADGRVIDPLKLFWSRVKAGETCCVEEIYKSLLGE
jgi:hypothetical protein